MKKIIFKVEGMMCAGCENRVKNALNQIEGVESVEASHEEKNVKVVTNGEVDVEEIKDKIDDLGFEVVEE